MYYMIARAYEEWGNRPAGAINGFFFVKAEGKEEAIKIAECVLEGEDDGASYRPEILRQEETAEGFSDWGGRDYVRKTAVGVNILNRSWEAGNADCED